MCLSRYTILEILQCLTFIFASAMLFAMRSLRQTGSGKLSPRVGRCRPETVVLILTALLALPLPRLAADEEQNSLFKNVLSGDAQAVVELTRTLTTVEISDRLMAMPRSVVGLADASVEVLERNAPGMGPWGVTLAVDARGGIDLVFVKTSYVDEHDYLGNPRRGISGIYLLRREPGQPWSAAQTLLSPVVWVNSMKLLVAPDGTLHVLTLVNNTAPEMRMKVAPGHYDLLHLQRPPGGAWTRPDSIDPVYPKLAHDADAVFDSEGRLHALWTPWFGNDTRQVVHHLTYSNGVWRMIGTLPGLEDRNFAHVRVCRSGPRLCALLTGQTTDYKIIDAYASCWNGERWNRPQLVEENVDFSLTTVSADLLGCLSRNGNGWQIFTPAEGQLKPLASLLLRGAGAYYPEPWEVPRLARVNGEAVGLTTRGCDIYMTHATPKGTAAVPFRTNPGGENAYANAPCLLTTNGRLLAAWGESNGEQSALCFYESAIPTNSFVWEPLEGLQWRLAAKVGLRRDDRTWLGHAVFEQARAEEKNGRIKAAIERYVYWVANFEDHDNSSIVFTAISELYRSHGPLLSAAIRRELSRSPSVNGSDQLRDLLRSLENPPQRRIEAVD